MDQNPQREPGEMPQRNTDASRPIAIETLPGGKSCVSGSLWGSPDTKSPFGQTRFQSYKSLARFQLRDGRRSADADPHSSDVAGSDPPSRHTSIGTGEDGAGQPHPPRRYGVAPSQQSLPEGCRAPLRGGGSPVRGPAGRRPARHRRARTGRGWSRAAGARSGSERATRYGPCRAASLWRAEMSLRGSGGIPPARGFRAAKTHLAPR